MQNQSNPTTGKPGRKPTGQVVVSRNAKTTTFALRFRAYGKRRYVTLGGEQDGWTEARAELELSHVLADVQRGIWQPPSREPEPETKDPTFHAFASEWFAAVRGELRETTQADYEWQLRCHLLPFFASMRVSQITVEDVDRYRARKVREGELSATSINKTLTRLAQILELAVEYGMLDRNPAKGKRRRLKQRKANRPYIDGPEQIAALLEAAQAIERDARVDRKNIGRRAILATMLFGGLRVGELCELRWRHVDLANGRLTVGTSKTDAGVRTVNLLPALRDDLATHKAAARDTGADALVFPTTRGGKRDKDNVRNRILRPAYKLANEWLEESDYAPLPERLTPHGLRHSFASILTALGRDPRYIMDQIGHSDPAFTLRVYTHGMRRGEDEITRLRALVEGELSVEFGQRLGSNDAETVSHDQQREGH